MHLAHWLTSSPALPLLTELGTTRYFDDPARLQTVDTADSRGLKCDRSGPIPIILVRNKLHILQFTCSRLEGHGLVEIGEL